jgi:hypothetical protein
MYQQGQTSDLATALRERFEKLLSPQARQMLGVGYDCADVPTVVIGTAAVPCLLQPRNDGTWELTCPWWAVRIPEDEEFEQNVLAHVGGLNMHLIRALVPSNPRTLD